MSKNGDLEEQLLKLQAEKKELDETTERMKPLKDEFIEVYPEVKKLYGEALWKAKELERIAKEIIRNDQWRLFYSVHHQIIIELAADKRMHGRLMQFLNEGDWLL